MAEGKDKFDINNDQKLKQDNLDKSDGPIAKTEILDGQPEQGILAQANGAPNVSGDVVNMAEMHSHMDDAAEHQVPEGPPQNPQGMGKKNASGNV